MPLSPVGCLCAFLYNSLTILIKDYSIQRWSTVQLQTHADKCKIIYSHWHVRWPAGAGHLAARRERAAAEALVAGEVLGPEPVRVPPLRYGPAQPVVADVERQPLPRRRGRRDAPVHHVVVDLQDVHRLRQLHAAEVELEPVARQAQRVQLLLRAEQHRRSSASCTLWTDLNGGPGPPCPARWHPRAGVRFSKTTCSR
jgi:hypothetical protein